MKIIINYAFILYQWSKTACEDITARIVFENDVTYSVISGLDIFVGGWNFCKNVYVCAKIETCEKRAKC